MDFTPPAGLAESFTVTATDVSNGAGGGQTASGESSPLVVTGLTGGNSYTFTVTASNGPVVGPPSSPSAPVVPSTLTTIRGEGSAFAAVAIQQWVGQFSTVDPSVAVDWTVDSSVIGLNNFAQDQIDFAASDLPYSAEQSTYSRHSPTSTCPTPPAGSHWRST